ncbi:MAG: PIN domain-containing protein [Crocinitomicaceae bacterium]|nr:PIN domain-containing protein [Crocinitomicaceae bacterium]
MKRILIDSDVILDLLLDRKPFCEDSLAIIYACEQKQLQGFVTPVIIANVYYIFRQKASHVTVTEQLKLLLNIISVLNMDQKQVLAALDSKFTDFEDALQYFSAIQSNKVDVIITRNTSDYKKSTLPVFTPNEFLATLA